MCETMTKGKLAESQNATLGRMVLAKIKEIPLGVNALKTRRIEIETGETTGSEEKRSVDSPY